MKTVCIQVIGNCFKSAGWSDYSCFLPGLTYRLAMLPCFQIRLSFKIYKVTPKKRLIRCYSFVWILMHKGSVCHSFDTFRTVFNSQEGRVEEDRFFFPSLTLSMLICCLLNGDLWTFLCYQTQMGLCGGLYCFSQKQERALDRCAFVCVCK